MPRRTPRRTRRVRNALCLSAALLAALVVAALATDGCGEPLTAAPESAPRSAPRDGAGQGDRGAIRPTLPSEVAQAHAREHLPTPARSARRPARSDRLLPSDHDVVAERSLLLVVELGRARARVRDVVPKRLPYRVLNGREAGRYRYRLEDAGGRVLHEGRFAVLDLCPLQGTRHTRPHVAGHVILAHQASVLVRVPDLPAARSIVFERTLPDIDLHPLFLGRARLQRG